ncbi:MAG: MltA domain-containing protein [Rhizobiales bacterium]|nr:MltA domain-containing protein [Hyphomicrobiales bacterium]
MTTSADDGGSNLNQVRLEPVAFSSLHGLSGDDLSAGLAAFRRQAHEIITTGAAFSRLVLLGGRRDDWLPVCRAALGAGDPLQFFTTHFRPYRVHASDRPEGLFTGYYEPEAAGSRVAGGDYGVPVYGKPDDLVPFTEAEERQTGLTYGRRIHGKAQPYFTRQEIESGALAGRGLELCYLKDRVDAFFIQIQGSGRVRLPDGSSLRLSYAAKSGLPYTGIGGVLVERGVISRENMSMQTLRAWMAAHPQEARELMWLNRSFVFFREIAVEDESLGAVGAARVNLTPHRSMAVDRAKWMFGTPFWVETQFPPEARRDDPRLSRLMIGQDTGSAIKGFVRGDFYWGWGEDAALIAGHMKSPGRMTALLPHDVAASLGLPR